MAEDPAPVLNRDEAEAELDVPPPNAPPPRERLAPGGFVPKVEPVGGLNVEAPVVSGITGGAAAGPELPGAVVPGRNGLLVPAGA